MAAPKPQNRPGEARISHASAQIERLRTPPLLQHQSFASYRVIMALRMLAACNRSGHDPLPLLAQRFASVTAARAVIAFADQVGLAWPEVVSVMRPCCGAVSHDELTIALMVDAAAAGQRQSFGLILDGFVRPGRHERLFELAKAAALLMP